MIRPTEPTNIEVAFSYRTVDRARLVPIVDALEERLGAGTIFIDYLYQAWLNGADTSQVAILYEKDAALVIRCWTPGYGETQWTRVEHVAIQNRSMVVTGRDQMRCHEVLECWLSTADVADHRPAVIHLDVPRSSLSNVVDTILEKLVLAKRYRTSGTVVHVVPKVASVSHPANTIVRTKIVDSIERAVAAPNARIVAIYGAEGTGKSTVLDDWLHTPGSTESAIRVLTNAVDCFTQIRDLESLIHLAAAATFGISLQEAEDLASPEKQSASICLVIDGINERGEVALWADLLRQAFASERKGLCVAVVTRTEHWQRVYKDLRGLEPALAGAYKRQVDESGIRRLITVEVPRFTLDEVRRYLAATGVVATHVPDDLLEALRIPRLLAIAAQHIDRLTSSSPPTYAMLQLLDFESRHGEQFLFEMEQRVRSELDAMHEADVPIPGYAERLRAVIASTTTLTQNDDLVWTALGVWLRGSLEPLAGRTHAEIIEYLEQALGASEHDARATILEFATTSALLDGSCPASIRIALIDRWLACRNRHNSPARRLGELLSLAPLDILDSVEGAIASTGYPRLADEFVDVIIAAVRGAMKDLLRSRLRAWLGYYSDAHFVQDGEEAKYRALVARLERNAIAANLPVRRVSDQCCELRTLALKVLLAEPSALDTEMLRAATAAVAINGRMHDGELLSWVLRRSPFDCTPHYRKLQQQCALYPRLRRRLAFVVWRASPKDAERTWLRLRRLKGMKIWYRRLAERMSDPDWHPSDRNRDLARFTSAAANHRHFAGDTSGIDELALEACIGGLAIHRPNVLRNILTTLCRHSAKSLRFRIAQMSIVQCFSEALPPDAVAVLVSRDWKMPAAADDSDAYALSLGWLIRQQRATRLRRVGQVAWLARKRLVWDGFVDGAQLDADAAHAFTKRCIQATHSQDIESRNAYAFVLSRCHSFHRLTRELLLDWLAGIHWSSMSSLHRERAEVIAWRLGAEHLVADAPDREGGISDIRSAATAESAACTMEQALGQCSPSHWPVWCETHSATNADCVVFTEALMAIHAKESLHTASLPMAAQGAIEKWRRTGLRIFRFTEGALRYWIAVVPSFLDRWLEIDVEPIHFTDIVEAAVARSHSNALNFVRKLWITELRYCSYTQQGLLRRVVVLAFRLNDQPDTRKFWRKMLDEARDDDELARFVVCALLGNGRRWLRELIDNELHSALPFEGVRARVIAGIAGFDDFITDIRGFPKSDGWVEQGRQFALEQFSLQRAAIAWYTRFRRTSDPMIRAGAWLQLMRKADVRFLELEYVADLYRTDAAKYHAKTHDEALRKAAAKYQDRLRKSLLGIPLPMSNDGWLARSERRL